MTSPVVVVGMHRSGTSLVGSLLSNLGIDMGDTAASDLHNVSGYYEDLALLKINEKILGNMGATWSNPPSEAAIEKEMDQIREIYREFVEHHEGRWGVKDPRLSLFIKPFLDVVENPKVIFCRRPVDQVAKSLRERDLVPEEATVQLRTRYNKAIEKVLSGYDHLIVEYDNLVNDPKTTVTAIADFVGVEMRDSALRKIKSQGELKREKSKHLLLSLSADIGRVLRKPNLLVQKSIFQRIRKYVHSFARLLKF